MSADSADAIWMAAENYFTPTTGRRVDSFVVHATAGVKAGDIPVLRGTNPRYKVTCHYYIAKDGQLYQFVRDHDIAWHAGVCDYLGDDDWNDTSLGLELENKNDGRDAYTPVQLERARLLVRAKVAQYKIPRERLVRHATIAVPPGRKTDPRNFPWQQFVADVYRTDTLTDWEVVSDEVWVRTGRSINSNRARIGEHYVTLGRGMRFKSDDLAPVNGWVHIEQPAEWGFIKEVTDQGVPQIVRRSTA